MENLEIKTPALHYHKVAEHIVKWLQDYAVRAKVEGFVVGVSGGIDSAVVSTLCAMTGLRTVCVLASIHPNGDQSRAARHMASLVRTSESTKQYNVDIVDMDLTNVFDQLAETIESPDIVRTKRDPRVLGNGKFLGLDQQVSGSVLHLALANLRARVRMCALYHMAGKHNLLVAGTGNRVEDFGIGFFTKYGDGGVDISPIADLMKSQVRALGAYLDVSEEIVNAKPTDGLWSDDRSDEDQIGATYDELERAMNYASNNWSSGAHFMTDRERKVQEIYEKRNQANLHKMRPIPVCHIRGEFDLLDADSETKELIAELLRVKDQKNIIVRKQDYEGAAKLRDEERKILDKLAERGIK